MGLGLVPLGISIILWEYFLRKERSDEIIEYVNNELTNALSARLSKLDSLESHGLIAIRPRVSNVELIEFIAKAKRRLFILTPWLGFVEPTVLEQIFKEKASIKGFSLKIILLHPDSMFLKKRAEVVFGSGTSGAYQSKKTLLILRNAFRLIQSNLVEVRTYDSLPSVFIVQCDDRALLGLHLNTGKTFANPHFEIRILNDDEKTTTLGGMIEDEFTKLSTMHFRVESILRV